jgi:hypothetical protein
MATKSFTALALDVLLKLFILRVTALASCSPMQKMLFLTSKWKHTSSILNFFTQSLCLIVLQTDIQPDIQPVAQTYLEAHVKTDIQTEGWTDG